jgi:hypothetical protein
MHQRSEFDEKHAPSSPPSPFSLSKGSVFLGTSKPDPLLHVTTPPKRALTQRLSWWRLFFAAEESDAMEEDAKRLDLMPWRPSWFFL